VRVQTLPFPHFDLGFPSPWICLLRRSAAEMETSKAREWENRITPGPRPRTEAALQVCKLQRASLARSQSEHMFCPLTKRREQSREGVSLCLCACQESEVWRPPAHQSPSQISLMHILQTYLTNHFLVILFVF